MSTGLDAKSVTFFQIHVVQMNLNAQIGVVSIHVYSAMVITRAVMDQIVLAIQSASIWL